VPANAVVVYDPHPVADDDRVAESIVSPPSIPETAHTPQIVTGGAYID
jgi:hypothetical protein